MSPSPSQQHPTNSNPAFWRNETTGQLADAVRTYLDNPHAMTMRQIAVMRVYLRQWIGQPRYSGEEIARLRQDVEEIRCGPDIAVWLEGANAMDIRPL